MDETKGIGDPTQLGQWVDTTNAAEILEVSERTVRRWIKIGRLRATRTDGGQRLVLIPGSGAPMAARRGGDEEASEADQGGDTFADVHDDDRDAGRDDDSIDLVHTVSNSDASAPGAGSKDLELRAATLAVAEVERALTLYREESRTLRAETRRARRVSYAASGVAVALLIGLVVVASVAVTHRANDRERVTTLAGDLEQERRNADAIRDTLTETQARLADSARRIEGLDARVAFQIDRADRAETRQGGERDRAILAEEELHRVRREYDALRTALAARDQATIDAVVGRLDRLESSLNGVEAALEPVFGPEMPPRTDDPQGAAIARAPAIPWSTPADAIAAPSGRSDEPDAPALAAPERRIVPPAPLTPDESETATPPDPLPTWILIPPARVEGSREPDED